jgi:ppGpp synthetase/RelA/SpoT-type nucleotidyltranferase
MQAMSLETILNYPLEDSKKEKIKQQIKKYEESLEENDHQLKKAEKELSNIQKAIKLHGKKPKT